MIMAAKRYRLKCTRCGARHDEARRIRTCRAPIAQGFGEYTYCGGQLVSLAPRKRRKRGLEDEIERVERQLTRAIARVKLAVTVLGKWQGRLRRLHRKQVEALEALQKGQQAGVRAIRREELP